MQSSPQTPLGPSALLRATACWWVCRGCCECTASCRGGRQSHRACGSPGSHHCRPYRETRPHKCLQWIMCKNREVLYYVGRSCNHVLMWYMTHRVGIHTDDTSGLNRHTVQKHLHHLHNHSWTGNRGSAHTQFGSIYMRVKRWLDVMLDELL